MAWFQAGSRSPASAATSQTRPEPDRAAAWRMPSMIGPAAAAAAYQHQVVPARVLDLEEDRGPDRGRDERRLLRPVVAEGVGGRGADHDHVARPAVGEHVGDLLADGAQRHLVHRVGVRGRDEQGDCRRRDGDPQRSVVRRRALQAATEAIPSAPQTVSRVVKNRLVRSSSNG